MSSKKKKKAHKMSYNTPIGLVFREDRRWNRSYHLTKFELNQSVNIRDLFAETGQSDKQTDKQTNKQTNKQNHWSLEVQHLPGMQDVPGSNPLRCNILCSPSPSEETINRCPNTPIPTTHTLICEELKDPGIPPKVGVERVSVTKQITSMHEN